MPENVLGQPGTPRVAVADIIAMASNPMALEAGDIIMTCTPEGVGPVKPGWLTTGGVITGGIEGLGEITLSTGGASGPRS